MTISPLQSVPSIGQAQGINPAQKNGSSVDNISKTFADMLDSLNQSELNSNNQVATLAAGGDVDLHEVMIGMEETDVQFRVALAIRDKLVDAYREVMRMQI